MVSTRKKRQSNRRLLSQLDDFDQDIIIGNVVSERQENAVVNEGTNDRVFTVGTSNNDSVVNGNAMSVKTWERCFNGRIDKEMNKIIDTVEDRIQNAILTAIDNIVAPKIELAIRPINASSGRDVTSVSANSERKERVELNASFENASRNNDTLDVSNVNDETRHNIPEEVSELSVPETHFDRQAHTHHRHFWTMVKVLLLAPYQVIASEDPSTQRKVSITTLMEETKSKVLEYIWIWKSRCAISIAFVRFPQTIGIPAEKTNSKNLPLNNFFEKTSCRWNLWWWWFWNIRVSYRKSEGNKTAFGVFGPSRFWDWKIRQFFCRKIFLKQEAVNWEPDEKIEACSFGETCRKSNTSCSLWHAKTVERGVTAIVFSKSICYFGCRGTKEPNNSSYEKADKKAHLFIFEINSLKNDLVCSAYSERWRYQNCILRVQRKNLSRIFFSINSWLIQPELASHRRKSSHTQFIIFLQNRYIFGTVSVMKCKNCILYRDPNLQPSASETFCTTH